ncbi:stage 0 sporulation protein [bacterium]|nr:stage 0 sporulation protein [bacterium]
MAKAFISYGKSENTLLCDVGAFPISEGSRVVIKTPRGEELGIVEEIVEEETLQDKGEEIPTGEILRVATLEDLAIWQENERKAEEAIPICEEQIEKHQLPIKLIDAEYTLDGTHLIFYFSAQERVDFRELVRSLASIFKVRIEMTQIGARDEAKRFGGLAPCGRILCCYTFLNSLRSITIRMIREQNLFANPSKYTGTCGRLMCCLAFELDYYEKLSKELPNVGTVVETPEGKGTVVDINFLKEAVVVEIEEKGKVLVPKNELRIPQS